MQGALPGRCASLLVSCSPWKPTPTTSALPQTTNQSKYEAKRRWVFTCTHLAGDSAFKGQSWCLISPYRQLPQGWSGDTHQRLRFRTCTRRNMFVVGNRHLGHFKMSERSLQWTLAKVSDLSTETERGCTQTHIINTPFRSQSQMLQRSEMPGLSFHMRKVHLPTSATKDAEVLWKNLTAQHRFLPRAVPSHGLHGAGFPGKTSCNCAIREGIHMRLNYGSAGEALTPVRCLQGSPPPMLKPQLHTQSFSVFCRA